ncbi:hypothetical protein MKW94_029463 [Papaver nudicaule]|uniref:Uncharacterized protein n=1 Tax=Papaver nudicaule TaxID=74823 RepID=A0AA41SE30_PAPNU|nr:hypothetical protein [Papaver nudicaule]
MKKKYSSCLFFMLNFFTKRRRSGRYYDTSSGDEGLNNVRRRRLRSSYDIRGPFGVAEPNIDNKATDFIAKFHCTTTGLD